MTSLITKFTGGSQSAEDASNTSKALQWRPSGRIFGDRDDFRAQIGSLVEEFNAQSTAAATALLGPTCPPETLTRAAASLRALDKAQREHDDQETQVTHLTHSPSSSGGQGDKPFEFSALDMARFTARKDMDSMPVGSHVQLTNLLEAQGMEEARLNELIQSLAGVRVIEEVEDSSSDDDRTTAEAGTSGA